MFEIMPWDEYRDFGEPDELEQSCVREVPCLVCGRDTPPERQAHCRQCQLDDDALGESIE